MSTSPSHYWPSNTSLVPYLILRCFSSGLKKIFFLTWVCEIAFGKKKKKRIINHVTIYLSSHSLLIQSTGRPERMLIYWKCCECSNGVLEHSSVRFSIHPFDHLALVLCSMYAKASCDEPRKHKNTYKHKLSLTLSSPLCLSSSNAFFFSLQHHSGFNPLKLISLCPHGGNWCVVKDN